MGMLGGQHQLQQPTVDRWLVEETQKLERQQRIQQQKLLELQQVMLSFAEVITISPFVFSSPPLTIFVIVFVDPSED